MIHQLWSRMIKLKTHFIGALLSNFHLNLHVEDKNNPDLHCSVMPLADSVSQIQLACSCGGACYDPAVSSLH